MNAKKMDVNGKVCMVYSVSDTAKKLGIKRITILKWLKTGLIPEPPRTPRHHRVFTERYINILKMSYKQYKVARGAKMNKEGFKERVLDLLGLKKEVKA